MKEYKDPNGIIKAKKEEINNNWYYVLIGPEPEVKTDSYIVIVYAYRNGRKMDYIDPLKAKVNFDLETRYTKKKRNTRKSIESIIAETVNEAVCKLEEKQENSEELNNKIEAALQANKEIHEE